jgi:hypothetical protein
VHLGQLKTLQTRVQEQDEEIARLKSETERFEKELAAVAVDTPDCFVHLTARNTETTFYKG